MKVLVTGGTGYIGSHTILKIIETTSWNVISADNHLRSSPKTLERIKTIANKTIVNYDVDLCDLAKTRNIFSKNPDISGVIHNLRRDRFAKSEWRVRTRARRVFPFSLARQPILILPAFALQAKLLVERSEKLLRFIPRHPLDRQVIAARPPVGWDTPRHRQPLLLRDLEFAHPEGRHIDTMPRAFRHVAPVFCRFSGGFSRGRSHHE